MLRYIIMFGFLISMQSLFAQTSFDELSKERAVLLEMYEVKPKKALLTKIDRLEEKILDEIQTNGYPIVVHTTMALDVQDQAYPLKGNTIATLEDQQEVLLLDKDAYGYYKIKVNDQIGYVYNLQTTPNLENYPLYLIDEDLEERMAIAQQVSSMVLGLRKKEKLKVRQPLQKIMVPVLDPKFGERIQKVQDLILSEVNVKEMELLTDTSGVLVKNIKPNFKTIGKKYGKQMKAISAMIKSWEQADIEAVEKNNGWNGTLEDVEMTLTLEDFDIATQDIPGWLVASEGKTTVALDITLNDDLRQEGIARELINRIQNHRKESGFDITDKIKIQIDAEGAIHDAVTANKEYICNEVLATDIAFGNVNRETNLVAEIEEGVEAVIELAKV